MKTKFHKDEYIVYGKTGVCLIDEVKPLSFHCKEDNTPYYILKPIGNSTAIVYVPTNNEDLVSKMRYVMTEADIDELLSETKGMKIDWIDNKNARADYFQQLVTSGNQQELILLVSCIYLQKQERLAAGKKLAASDETILRTAERLIEEEFSFSLNIPEKDVAKYIQERMEINYIEN